MKILVSSRCLATCMGKIDFEGGEYITSIKLNNDELIFFTENKSVSLIVFVIISGDVSVRCHRWDWVKRLVTKIEEQPILLDINNDFCNVIFQY